MSKNVYWSRVFFVFCIWVFLSQYSYAAPIAEWTILNYIEADNNIERYGLHNISAMQQVGSTNKVNILVQLDDAHFIKTWRYKIIKNGIAQNVSLNQEMGVDPEKELTESMTKWVLPTYPAKRLMLIFWNHGNGILDEPSEKGKYFKNKKKRQLETQEAFVKRGILYDYSQSTFLNNQQLDRALRAIVAQNNGKKIDIIGMDACLMGMLEVAYQIKDYACYFVASQNVEHVPGWNYTSFLSRLVANPEMPTQFLVREIVDTFASFNIGFQSFTQSATRLDKIEQLKNDVNFVLQAINACKILKPKEVKSGIISARRATLQFYDGNYIDLYCFYSNLLRFLVGSDALSRTPYSKAQGNLKAVLSDAMQHVQEAVVVCKNGKNCCQVQGLSVYYPKTAIHPSYALTKFAQDTQWPAFIAENKVSLGGKARSQKIVHDSGRQASTGL